MEAVTGPPVWVLWRDSHVSTGWHSIEQAKDERNRGMEITSVGFLLESNADRVRIVQTRGVVSGAVSEVLTIPREAVLVVRELDWCGVIEVPDAGS